MMINEAVFYQSNATLAQNINQLFSLRHFTYLILLSQKIFAKCNLTHADTSEEIIWKFATKCLQRNLRKWEGILISLQSCLKLIAFQKKA